MPFLLKKSAQGYLLYILYKNRSTHKFPKSSEHNIVPPPFHLDTLTSKLLPSAIQHHAKLAFVVLVVPNQSESILTLHQIIWLEHAYLERDATILDPVSSFVVNFYWTVETSDGTHQSVHNQLY